MAATAVPDEKPRSLLPGPELLTLPGLDYQRASITSAALSDVPSDVIIKSRIRYGSRLSACKGLLLEYSKSTTIHGIRYIFEVHRPIYEKLYWLVLICTSVYFAVSLIWATYLKWQDSPVILGFDETLVPVHMIPFPTITICPEIKMERNIFDYANVSESIWRDFKENNEISSIDEEDLERLAATMHICDTDVAAKFAPLISKLRSSLTQDVTETLVDLSISKNATGPFCKWNGRFYFCNKLFDFVATDEGICYQFNGLRPKDIYRDERFISYVDPDVVDFQNFFDTDLPRLNNITGNWSLGSGFVDQGQNSYPQRTVVSSVRNGFFAFLQGLEHNYDYDCRSFKQGYKVFLNSPESVPLTSGNYILVPHGHEVMVSVLPNYVVSTDNLHEISAEKRQCYFDDERALTFFRSYSQSNCQTECLANFTMSKCGCVKFWMPKPLDVPVCGLADISCYTAAQDELYTLLQNQTIQQSIDVNAKVMCNCMPACTSLEYNFEISRAFYNVEKTIKAFREVYEHTDAIGSRLTVYFKEHQFTAIKRTILFGVSTLISNCGGIFGLFMGISSLSFIELVYFFSMRICGSCSQRRKRKAMRQLLPPDQKEPDEVTLEP
ncbi:pickpocket protein 28 [Drosophila grimshawi]|uniref:GH20995 n=1 Tax=Drosophila grimshawi TaxID=7222 RepID=B4J4V3_DROGR|nr:pickpocket protein 28 [Drosophila grimshawi]EDW00649.1 GH20995 [Drosophila grimshawi]